MFQMARYFVTLSTQTKYLAARIKRKVNKYTKHAKSNVKKKLYNRQIVGRANTSGFNLTTLHGLPGYTHVRGQCPKHGDEITTLHQCILMPLEAFLIC